MLSNCTKSKTNWYSRFRATLKQTRQLSYYSIFGLLREQNTSSELFYISGHNYKSAYYHL